jgi:pimeloyl-ACP methyl ester carboxylesterase
MLFCIIGLFFVVSFAHGKSVFYPNDMLCGSSNGRADIMPDIHEHIANTKNGGAIAYYRFGHGSPIVMITGYRSSLAEWNTYFLGVLAKKHEVIIFDNRGIGHSIPKTKNYGIKEMAEDTAQLIKVLGFRKVSVIGWSMGGMIAQQLVIDQPKLVTKLVLINTIAPGRTGTPLSSDALKILSGETPDNFEKVINILFTPATKSREKQCFVNDMFTPLDYQHPVISSSVMHAQKLIIEKWGANESIFHALHTLSTPTLLLVGKGDRVVSPDNSAALHSIIPNATLKEILGSGHAMMYEFPQQLAECIVHFLL